MNLVNNYFFKFKIDGEMELEILNIKKLHTYIICELKNKPRLQKRKSSILSLKNYHIYIYIYSSLL